MQLPFSSLTLYIYQFNKANTENCFRTLLFFSVKMSSCIDPFKFSFLSFLSFWEFFFYLHHRRAVNGTRLATMIIYYASFFLVSLEVKTEMIDKIKKKNDISYFLKNKNEDIIEEKLEEKKLTHSSYSILPSSCWCIWYYRNHAAFFLSLLRIGRCLERFEGDGDDRGVSASVDDVW